MGKLIGIPLLPVGNRIENEQSEHIRKEEQQSLYAGLPLLVVWRQAAAREKEACFLHCSILL